VYRLDKYFLLLFLSDLKLLSALEEDSYMWGTEKETEAKLRDDGSLVYPSQFIREARFEIDDFNCYKDGKEQLILRSFYFDYRLGLDQIYLSIQKSDETFFYGEAYHFTDYMAGGSLRVYESDLNQDGRNDYILIKYAGGSGIGSGTAEIGFLLSSGIYPGYTLQVMHAQEPDEMDFVIIEGKPHYIDTSFHYGDICKDGKHHNFWVYNLYRFEGDKIVLSNESSKEFPKTIFYSFKPNSKETDLLYPKQKARMLEESINEIRVKKGELAIEWRGGVRSIINAFKTKDINEIASVINYPIRLKHPFKIKDKEDFFWWYDLIIDDYFMDLMANSTIDDWQQIGWRGVCFGQGLVWLGDASNGLINAINYSTDYGKQRFEMLNKKTKAMVHPSVSNYKVNKMDLISDKYRIRLDYLEDESLRLSVWDASSSIGLKPLFVVLNGEEEWQGSGGYYCATFRDGNRSYEYSPPAKEGPKFLIYEDGELIYSGDVSDYPYELFGGF
jgi:hypothetical protein